MSSPDSFPDWAGRLRAGDERAAAELLQQFAGRLAALARQHLELDLRRKLDPEDVVQSALRSFFHSYADGQLDFDSWQGLWAVLATITLRKCSARREYFHAARRDVQHEVSLRPGDEAAAVWASLAREPAPDEVAVFAELLERLLHGLDERDRLIVLLYLQGYTVPAISEQVGWAERTVHRTLHRIRKRLRLLQDNEPQSA
jgi:RNA polymerase sigma-70 factor (ECF subfamily)